ncbi:MAG TPA: S8 family serine peptidase [Candidatus Kapabacteria bacterium]|nr:S8 family serine peptidase [Candidatus Kapabacteria bacterium]
MKKVNLILKLIFIILFLKISIISAQTTDYYRIFLKDKGPQKLEFGNSLYEKTLQTLSKKSIDRRSKGTQDIITIEDVPIYGPYLDSIQKIKNVEIVHQLKWLNYLLIKTDSLTANYIANIAFVAKIYSTHSKFETNSISDRGYNIFDTNKMQNSMLVGDLLADSSYYGGSFLQISSLNIDLLHRLGIMGQNILLGLLDSGFRWKKHKSLINSNVLAEYDFVNNDNNTANDSLDQGNQDSHGTAVLSLISGYDKGKLIGTAPQINLVLSKTEDISKEIAIEEDNYAAAIEWMDSIGVDIMSASLGYRKFDSSYYSYTTEDLDGNSTLVSKYVNMAVKRGIIFFNAAGNNGIGNGTLNSPADADLVLAVGSLDSNLINVSGFSSRGPNANGIIKPDFVAFGNRPVCANANDSLSYTVSSGTSLSTPLLAGGAGLILSTFPELTPAKFKEVLVKSSDNQNSPNNDKGYGMPNIYEAMINYDIVISPINYFQSQNFVRVVVYLAYKYDISLGSLFIKFAGAANFEQYILRKGFEDNQYFCDISIDKFKNEVASANIIASSGFKVRRMPYNIDDYFLINPFENKINPGVKIENLPEVFIKNSNSFVNPSISHINSNNFIEVNIFGFYNARLLLFDSFGNIIREMYINERNESISKIRINIQNLAIGAYFIGIVSDKNKEILKFLIVD